MRVKSNLQESILGQRFGVENGCTLAPSLRPCAREHRQSRQVRSNHSETKRFKTNFQCRRPRLQPKVTMHGIQKLRVGDQRVNVQPP